ncbi:PAS domain S-box protein [Nitratidesulfovibrio sp. 1201_IL3209]|uniref:PAS domain S-box protein n=1 Tax=Nitratidesulfovibrio sp. 1201_IL3209 TaxID=3084053 RepID=UPI002FDAB69F
MAADDGLHDHDATGVRPVSGQADGPAASGDVPQAASGDIPDMAERHRLLLEHLPSGYSLHEMLWDEHGQPCDYRFLDVNPAFEAMTGLARDKVLGRTLLEVLPGIERRWVDIYGRVVRTGESVSFEHRDALLGRHWEVRAWRVEPNRFAVVFSDATRCRVMEDELRRSSALQRAMIRNIPFDLWARDATGRVAMQSDISVAMWGDLTASPDSERDVPEATRTGWEGINARARAGETVRHEHEVQLPDGRRRVFSSVVAPIRDETGEGIPGILGINIDITEQRVAELALRESEQRFRALVANLPGVVYRCEAEPPWRALFVSDQVEQLTGHPAAEYQSGRLPLEHIIHPEDRARVAGDVAAANDPDGHFSLEYRVVHEDGTQRSVIEQGRRVRGDEGREFLDGVILDVTPLREALRELAAARDFLDAVMEAMPSALAGVGPDGVIIHWNRAAEEASGLPRDAARGRPAAEVLSRLVGVAPEVHEAVARRQAARFEGLPRVAGGMLRHLDVMLFPLTGQAGSPGVPGAVIVRVDDVTERTRLADMLVQTEKMLSVGGLAGGMAHELNNPLGAVLQGVQNIVRRLDPDLPANARAARETGVSLTAMRAYMEARRISEMLEGIRDAGTRAADIIATMLEFTRPGQGRRTTARAHSLAERALALAGSDYDLRRQYDFRKLHVVRDYAEDDDTLTCVPTEIEQVLLNLFKNAAHAMAEKRYPAGQAPALLVATRREGDEVVIVVQDNGPGMEPEVRRRAFEPFFTTKPPGVGTGLGLAVSYFIVVRTHGGSIACDGVPGEGARFTVRLPARQAVDG